MNTKTHHTFSSMTGCCGSSRFQILTDLSNPTVRIMFFASGWNFMMVTLSLPTVRVTSGVLVGLTSPPSSGIDQSRKLPSSQATASPEGVKTGKIDQSSPSQSKHNTFIQDFFAHLFKTQQDKKPSKISKFSIKTHSFFTHISGNHSKIVPKNAATKFKLCFIRFFPLMFSLKF